MYLKRVEIYGFKSFAEKIELEFGPGITAVVGPNGSGKSNITDAVRWALGEQSARELRGAKMEDVIFAGTDRRRPLGLAEVAITIDNAGGALPLPFTEIRVARRVDRAGEGEYLLNGVPCRLKDIHELFADTGIGKEAYSFIGQGKIDEILLSKPEDRRGLFEEAAGIVKYKNRKREAARKLEETTANLLRLGDIMGELEVQVVQLEEQARKAEAYQEYHSELETLEIQSLVKAIREAREKWEAQRAANRELRARIAATEGQLSGAEGELEELRGKLGALEGELASAQERLMAASGRVEKGQGKVALASEKVAGLEEDLARLDRETSGARERVGRLEEQAAREGERREKLAAEAIAVWERLTAAEEELSALTTDITARNEALEGIKEGSIDLLRRISDRQSWLGSGEKGREEVARRLDKLKGDQAAALEARDREAAAMAGARVEVENLERESEEVARELARGRRRKEEADADLGRLAEEERRQRDRVQALDSRLRLLEEMHREHEGYQKGARSILAERDSTSVLAGVIGVAAELLTVPREYEKAIETAMGPALQNLVTGTDRDAEKAINWLKEKGAGRATFLPLNTVRGSRLSPGEVKGLDDPGAVGIALDLVKFDSRYADAMAFLLGRLLVARDMKAALRIGKLNDLRYRVVTLDGDILNPGGSMTGGSTGARAMGLLGRERERAEAGEELARLKARLEETVHEFQRARQAKNEAEERIAACQRRIHEIELALAGRAKDLARLQEERARWNETADLAEIEIAQFSAEMSGSQRLAAQWAAELAGLEEEKAALDADVSAQTEEIRDLGARRDALNEEITRLRVRRAEIRQEDAGLSEQATRTAAARAEIEESLRVKTEERARISSRKAGALAELETLRRELAGLEASRAEAEAALNALQDRRRGDVESLSFKEREIRSLRRSLADAQNKLHAGELEETRQEMEAQGGMDRLFDQHRMSFAEAAVRVAGLPENPDAHARCEELRARIEELGPVNLMALEEFRKVRERHEFLTKQTADLEEARGSLYRVIEEMDGRIKNRFAEAFRAIREQFNLMFQKLFDGGRADLVLVDEQNLLETGVDIIAQPPGKKLQNLSLLSGGEKALAAIALLFAILRIKPAPFCILDEIDAALDDANVDRFAEVLGEFSRSSQFIVITHQKGTMSAADVLYGVTMEEFGVSKLLSVRLAQEAS